MCSKRSLETDRNLLSFDTKLHAFIKDYHKGHADAIEITKKHISTESQRNEGALKHHVTQVTSQTENAVKQHMDLAIRSLVDQKKDTQLMQRVDRLLRSLKFDRMNERKNHVSASHPRTCTWILQDGSEDVDTQESTEVIDTMPYMELSFEDMKSPFDTIPWDSFSDWLRSTETMYWISGKPGSGKSTVMKYLVTQSRTQDYLNVWRPDAMIVSHYFWRPGSVMQQSVKGLLCSLVHQLLSGDLPTVEAVLQSHKYIIQKDADTDWSEEELKKLLEDIVSGYTRPILIFLDGLDEMLPKEGVLKLIHVIRRLIRISESSGKIKICLASRPEPLLVKFLEGYPKLRLEHLNWTDLRQYAQDNIQIPDDYNMSLPLGIDLYCFYGVGNLPDIPYRDKLKHWLVKSLVEKAEGVFLWLYLTVTTIVNALEEGQTFEDLKSHIENLPADLSDLFVDMWDRTNDNNSHLKRRAALYFQLALAVTAPNPYSIEPLSPFIMMVATNRGIRNRISEPDSSGPMPVEQLIGECERTMQDVMARCAGLLVCSKPTIDYTIDFPESPIPWPQYGEEYEKLVPYVFETPQYSFLHRTVRDFLIETDTGKNILGHGHLTGNSARLKLIEAHLVNSQLFRHPICTVYLRSSNNVFDRGQNLLAHYLEVLCSYELDIKDVESQKEQTRLIFLVKHLFDHGIIFGHSLVKPEAMQFDQVPRRKVGFAYETTVKRQHEFFIEATFHASAMTLETLLPIFDIRNVDVDTLSQILIQLCDLGPPSSFHIIGISKIEDLESRVAFINHVLDYGAPPESSDLYQTNFDDDMYDTSSIILFGTPLKVLVTSLWNHTIDGNLSGGHIDSCLGLVSRLVDGGASLKQHIYVTMSLSKGRIALETLWTTYPNASMNFIMAYPIFSLLAIIHRIRHRSLESRVDYLSELGRLAKEEVGQGQLIAVLIGSEYITGTRLTPEMFRLTRGIYLLEPDEDLNEHLVRLTRFMEYSFDEAIRKTEFLEYDESTSLKIENVSIPPKIKDGAIKALQRMDASKVSLKERRRRLRERLGIHTPFEEAEWQGDRYEASLQPPPPFTKTSFS